MTTMRTLLLVLSVLLLMTSTVLQAQSIIQETDIPPFKGIDLQGQAEVYLTYGNTQKVTVEGPAALVANLSTTVNSKGIWNIHTRGIKTGKQRLHIYITTPLLPYITLSGSGNISSDNQLNMMGLLPLQPVEIELSGEGNLDLKLKCRKVVVHLSGTGNISLGGETGILNTTLSGTGHINASRLATKSAKVMLSGTGKLELNARDWLNAQLTGSGDILYQGNPPFNVTQVTGTGQITQRS